jgi:chitin disaccharide deacetylase
MTSPRSAPLTELLTHRMGHPSGTRLVIIAVDGIGMLHASTAAGYDSLRRGFATSGRLMVPCPWARAAAADFRGEDVGVSLTLTAELERFRWGPITHAPSLVDGNGGFPATAPDFWEHASVDEVRRETRAQIERAIWWGFDVSHLDAHLDAMHLRPEFYDVALELAAEFQLPLRLPNQTTERTTGFPFRRLAAEEGVFVPDWVIDVGVPAAPALELALRDLQPGVTELRLRPGIDSPELRATRTDGSWSTAVDHHATLTDPVFRTALNDLVSGAGAELVGYRTLRAAQRASVR